MSADEPLFLEVDDVLDLHAVQIELFGDALYDLTIAVAEGRMEKAAVAVELERIAKAPS